MIEIFMYVLKALMPRIQTDSRVTSRPVTMTPTYSAPPSQRHGIPVAPITPVAPVTAKPPTASVPTFTRSDKVATIFNGGTAQVYQRTPTGTKPVYVTPGQKKDAPAQGYTVR